ncbi:MAG: urate hydroxylase PuuD [Deinococcus sp.]|nr:urate hydroxylase PuuD [Deinococcus sp.]
MEFLLLVFRWIHFVAGIIWIGLLYFFNLVNVPYTKTVEAKDRPAHVPKLLPRALAWFRHAAWVTVLAGLVLIIWNYWRFGRVLSFSESPESADPAANTIFVGMLLGLIMLINVWGFIWPNQKKVIGATVKGEKPDPQWGKTALLFSRTNFVLSFPMLLFMGSATHYPMGWLYIIIFGIIAAIIGYLVVNTVQK